MSTDKTLAPDIEAAVHMAESLGWDIDPDGDGRGIAELAQIVGAANSMGGKTLADVKPGGRVRLGDQALRVFSAGRWTYDGTGQSFSHEEMDAAAFVVYRDAALSAQPSPGGQGDAVTASMIEAAVGAFFKGQQWSSIGDRVAVEAKMRGTLEAALAARQPVTMKAASDGMLPAALAPVADEWYRLCERRFAVGRIRISGKLAEAIVQAVCAARQPVGAVPQGCDACDQTGIRQNDEGRNICCPDCDLGKACAGDTRQPVGEPVLYIRPGLLDACRIIDPAVPYHRVTVALTERDGHTVPLYAGSPAQPVDLDAMHAAACAAWNKHQEACRITTVTGSLRKVCEALLDSQAVGK